MLKACYLGTTIVNTFFDLMYVDWDFYDINSKQISNTRESTNAAPPATIPACAALSDSSGKKCFLTAPLYITTNISTRHCRNNTVTHQM